MLKFVVEFLGTMFLSFIIFSTGNYLAIGFALAAIKTEQFAVFAENYSPIKEANVTTSLEFKINESENNNTKQIEEIIMIFFLLFIGLIGEEISVVVIFSIVLIYVLLMNYN